MIVVKVWLFVVLTLSLLFFVWVSWSFFAVVGHIVVTALFVLAVVYMARDVVRGRRSRV